MDKPRHHYYTSDDKKTKPTLALRERGWKKEKIMYFLRSSHQLGRTANPTNKHPAPLSLLQIRLVLVGPHVSTLGDPGVVQLVLLGRIAHGRHGFGHAAVAIKVRLGRDVLVEEADDDSGDDGGDGRDDGEVESPGEGVEDRPLHFLSELSHEHHAEDERHQTCSATETCKA